MRIILKCQNKLICAAGAPAVVPPTALRYVFPAKHTSAQVDGVKALCMSLTPRSCFALVVSLSLLACNKPQADVHQAVETPTHPSQTTPAPNVTPTRSLTVSSVFIDPKIATICGMSQPKAFFEFDSAVVEAAEDKSLATLAQCATTGPLKGRKLDLIGHTDPRGTDEYNAKLGQSRAQAVETYLARQGMEACTMNVKSEGEQGTAPNSPEEFPYDRLVDIRLAD